MKHTLCLYCRALALLLVCAGALRAQVVWTGSTDNDWFTGNNWDSTAVPGSGNNVTIDNGTPVISGSSTSVNFIFMGSASPDSSLLTIQDGRTLTSGQALVGYGAGSTGTVIITGSGSTWNLGANVLNIGWDGTGLVAVKNGGSLTASSIELAHNSGSFGTLVIGNEDFGSEATAGSVTTASINGGSGTATLMFNHSDNITMSANLTGSLSVESYYGGYGATTTLTGTNTYTGGTVINGGMLQFAQTASLPTTGTLTVYGTAAFNVGGAGEFTLSDISDPVTGILAVGSFQPYANLGLDTTHATGNFVYSDVLADSANGLLGLVKLGDGTLELTQANTYSGNTTINGGTLLLSGSGTLGNSNGSLVVNSGGTLDLGTTSQTVGGVTIAGGTIANGTLTSATDYDAQSGTVSANLQGDVNLNKTTGDTLILSGANTYTGSTNVGDGTLEVASGGSISNTSAVGVGVGSTLVVDAGGSVTAGFNGVNIALGGAVIVSGTGAQLTIVDGGSLSVGSNGAGSLTIANGGTVDASAAYNSTVYLGLNDIANVGTLNFGAAATDTAAAGGILNVATIMNADGQGTVQFNTTATSGSPFFLTNDGTSTGAAINISNNVQIINTAGYTVFTGSNDTNGATSLNGGTLEIRDHFALQNSTVSLNGGDLVFGTGLTDATLGALAGTGNLALANTDTNGVMLTLGRDNVDTTYAGNLSGADGSLTKNGTGTQVLTGTNTYGNGTTVNYGTLQFGHTYSLPTTGTLNVVSGATAAFNVGGTDEFTSTEIDPLIAGCGFQAGASLGLDTSNATGGGDGHTYTYNSVIADTSGGANALSLVKLGTGTLEFTQANTYSGGTTINNGTLLLSGAGTLGASSNTVTVNPAGTLDIGDTNQTVGGVVIAGGTINGTTGTLTSATDIDARSGTVSAILAGTAGLTKTTTDTVTLTGANTYSGNTTISEGTLVVAAGGVIAGGFITGGDMDVSSISSTSSLLINGGEVRSGFVNIGHDYGSGSATITGGSWTIDAGLGIGAVGGSGSLTISGGVLNVDSYNYPGARTGTIWLADDISGSYDPTWGTLNLGSGDSSVGTINAAEVYGASSGAVVNFDHNDPAYTFALNLTGALNVNQLGSGTTILTGTNTYSGNTTVSNGTLTFGGAGTLGTGTVISQGGTLDLAGTTQTVGGVVIAGGSIIDTGVSPGALISASDYDAQSGTVSANLQGGVALVKSTGGIVTLTGTNTYTNGTVINEGALVFGQPASLPDAANFTVNSGATAGFMTGGFTECDITTLLGGPAFADGALLGLDTTNGDYTYHTPITDTPNGSLGLNKLGLNALTLPGANTFTGPTQITAGTLELGDSAALQYSTLTTSSGGGTLSFGLLTTATLGGLGGDGNITLRTKADDAGVALLVGNNNADTTYTGNLTGSGGSLTKIGAGTQTLSGTNDYDGGTTVSTGTLQFAKTSALPTSGTLSVQSGATAAFNVGGDGEFGSGDLDSVIAHSSFTAGSFIGFDTTNAPMGYDSDFGFNYSIPYNYDVSGLTGDIGVVKLGSQILGLTGTLTYTGDTIVRQGELDITGVTDATDHSTNLTVGQQTGDSAYLTIYDAGVARATNVTAGAATGSTGTVNVTAGGGLYATNLTIAGAGNASFTVVNNGTATTVDTVIGRDSGSSGSAVADGSGTTWTNSGTITVGDSGTGELDLAHSVNVTSGSVVLGASAGGAGTLDLDRDNIYGAGTLTTGQISRGAGSGAINIDLGTLRATGNQADFLSGFQDGDVQILSGGATIDSDIYNIGITVALQGEGGLTKAGTGTLTLSGANTYSGGTTVNDGTLTLSGAGTLGDEAGTITAAGGTLDLGGFSLNAGGVTISGGTITNGTLTSTTDYDAQSGAVSAILAGCVGLTKSTSGTVTLSGANTYTGNTTISEGTLEVGASLTLQHSTVDLSGGSLTFGSSVTAATLGGLTGSGNLDLTNSTDPVALSVGNNNADTTYSGNLGDGPISTGGSLTKIGNGTLTLMGTNTYTGGTTVSTGTLEFGQPLALPGTGLLSVAAGATAAFNVNTTGGFTDSALTSLLANPNLTFASGAFLGLDTSDGNYTFGTVISDTANGPFNLVKLGDNTITFTAANTYSGGTTVRAGTLEVAVGGGIDHAGADLEVSGSSTPAFNVTGGTVTVAASRVGVDAGNFGTATLSAGSWTSSSVVVGTNGGTGTLILGGGTMTVGSGGSGTLVLADGVGSTGTLQIVGDNTSVGTLMAAEVHGAGGTAVVDFHHSADSPFYTFAPNLTGNLSVTQTGDRQTILTGTNTYSGGTTISDGTLAAGSAGALPNNTAYVINGGALDMSGYALTMSSLSGSSGTVYTRTAMLTVNQSADTVYSGGFDNGAQLTKSGSGRLTLGSTNTYNGGTTVTGGTLQLGANNAIGAGSLTLGGGTLNLNNLSQVSTTLTLTGNSILDFGGTGGAISFGSSSALTWSGTLTLLNYSTGSSQLQFGIDSSGLTAGQLSLISASGLTGFALNGSGFLTATAIPEPATYAAIFGLGALGLVCLKRRRGDKYRTASTR